MHTAHELPDVPCPECGVNALRVELRLAVRTLAALAGMQPKMTGSYRPWLVCGSCGIEAAGEPATA
jgi:hypothetical protein